MKGTRKFQHVPSLDLFSSLGFSLFPPSVSFFLSGFLFLSNFPLLVIEERLWGNLDDVPFFFFLKPSYQFSLLGNDTRKWDAKTCAGRDGQKDGETWSGVSQASCERAANPNVHQLPTPAFVMTPLQ